MKRSFIQLLKKLGQLFGFSDSFSRSLMFQLQLLLTRILAPLSPLQRATLKLIQGEQNLRVNFGSGGRKLEGWINVDGVRSANTDLALDLRRPLPFITESVQFIFSEHLIEHLEKAEAQAFLQECYRILQPNGAIRLITPDLYRFAKAYIENDEAFYQTASPRRPTPIDGFNFVMRQRSEHLYLFDYQTLAEMLKSIGFREISRSECQQSRWDELNLDVDTQQRAVESLYIEAVK